MCKVGKCAVIANPNLLRISIKYFHRTWRTPHHRELVIFSWDRGYLPNQMDLLS
jgi:hypothetical protein